MGTLENVKTLESLENYSQVEHPNPIQRVTFLLINGRIWPSNAVLSAFDV